jgi:hypothetical protein
MAKNSESDYTVVNLHFEARSYRPKLIDITDDEPFKNLSIKEIEDMMDKLGKELGIRKKLVG